MEGIEYQVTDKIKTSFISPESYNTVSCTFIIYNRLPNSHSHKHWKTKMIEDF